MIARYSSSELFHAGDRYTGMKDTMTHLQGSPDKGKIPWIKPELKELDCGNTQSGDIHPTELTSAAGPS
jgi:hypothetical protein